MINPPFEQTILIYVLLIWSLIWKGIALWKSAKQNQRNWFIVLLLPIGTVGILEIVYLFGFSKKKMTIDDIKNWFMNTFFTKPDSK